MGDFANALVAARQMLSLAKKSPTARKFEVVDARQLVATLETAIELYSTAHRRLGKAYRLHVEGYALYDSGDFETCRRLQQEAIDIVEPLLGVNHPDVAQCLKANAMALQAQHRHREAAGLLQRALSINEAALGPEHPEVAAVLNSLSLAYGNDQHMSAEAEAMLQRSLRKGGLVALPTDTVYGIGALAFDGKAVESIYNAKERPVEKAIPILIADIKDLNKVASTISYTTRRLASRFWPGPLTCIVPKKPTLPAAVSATDTVGVRIPDHAVARILLRLTGPMAVTSTFPVDKVP